MPDKYTRLLDVIVPAGGTLTVPHGLVANGQPVAPMIVQPNQGTLLEVTAVTTTTVTFTNPDGAAALGARFLCVYLHSIQSLEADVPPGAMLWQGQGPGGGAAGGVFWEPGGPGAVQTWADVMAVVSASEAPLPIWVSNAYGVPTIPAASGTSDLHWCWFQSQTLGGLGQTTVELEDGAVLHNLWGCIGNAGVHMHPTTGPCLTFTTTGGNPPILSLQSTGGMQNSGTVPAIEDVGFFVLLLRLAGGLVTGTAPVLNIGPGAIGVVGFANGGVFPNDVISSTDGTATLVIQTDGTGPSPLPTQAGFTGTQSFSPQGSASTWTTPGRPVPAFGPLPVGLTGYNTTLASPEWWDGAAWVTAGGGAAALAAVLVVGNITGGKPIIVSAGDDVRGVDAAGGSGLPGSQLLLRGGIGDGAGDDGDLVCTVTAKSALRVDVGGNARGASAIDLQVTRLVATEVASGQWSAIGGGGRNTADVEYATVGGGSRNVANDSLAAPNAAPVVGGGFRNRVFGTWSTIGGGAQNYVGLASSRSTIAGGQGNEIADGSLYATIGGGAGNLIAAVTLAPGNSYGVIAGGDSNQIGDAKYCSVAGGHAAFIADTCSFGGVTHGEFNKITLNPLGDPTLYARVGGSRAVATNSGEEAFAAGIFSADGDAQRKHPLWRGTTTDAIPTDLYIEPATLRRYLLTDHTSLTFALVVSARTLAGDTAGFRVDGVIKRLVGAASTALVGVPTVTPLGSDVALAAATVAAVANVAQGGLGILATGVGGTNVRWVVTGTMAWLQF